MAPGPHRDVPVLLLCDVDGVLSPHRPRSGTVVRRGVGHATIPDDVAAWVDELAPWVQWCWATAWEHDANDLLAPVLDLAPAPVVPLTCSGRDSWKLHAVASFVDHHAPDRAVIWLDDHIGNRAQRWARTRPAPTQVVPVHGHTGLQRHHVDQVLEFARRNRNIGDGTRALDHATAPGLIGARRALFLAVRGCTRWWSDRQVTSGDSPASTVPTPPCPGT